MLINDWSKDPNCRWDMNSCVKNYHKGHSSMKKMLPSSYVTRRWWESSHLGSGTPWNVPGPWQVPTSAGFNVICYLHIPIPQDVDTPKHVGSITLHKHRFDRILDHNESICKGSIASLMVPYAIPCLCKRSIPVRWDCCFVYLCACFPHKHHLFRFQGLY